MKYKCPNCGSEENIKWWRTKSRYTCEHCNNHIFAAVKNQLQTMYFIVIFLGSITSSWITLNFDISGWNLLLFIVLWIIIMYSIFYLLELIICRKFNNYEK